MTRMPVIRVIDLEATGFAPEGVPIEIGWCDAINTSFESPPHPQAWVLGSSRALLCSPGCAIPPESSAVHHLIEADLVGAPDWETVRRTALEWRDGSEQELVALCAHNAAMEANYLPAESDGGLPWIDTWKCALRLWPEAPSHSNQALRYWRNPAGLDRRRAAPAHRAGPDAYVTAHLLRDMLAGGATIEQLVQWSTEPALLMRVPFGRDTRGMRWSEVDDGFLQWVLERDFNEDVMFTAQHEVERRKAIRAAMTEIRLGLAEFYSAEEIETWLKSPQTLLDGAVAYDLVLAGKSDEVKRLIAQLRDGVYL